MEVLEILQKIIFLGKYDRTEWMNLLLNENMVGQKNGWKEIWLGGNIALGNSLQKKNEGNLTDKTEIYSLKQIA